MVGLFGISGVIFQQLGDPPAMRAGEGDPVQIGQCNPLEILRQLSGHRSLADGFRDAIAGDTAFLHRDGRRVGGDR